MEVVVVVVVESIRKRGRRKLSVTEMLQLN